MRLEYFTVEHAALLLVYFRLPCCFLFIVLLFTDLLKIKVRWRRVKAAKFPIEKQKHTYIQKSPRVCVCVLRISLSLALSLTFPPQDQLICIDVTATGWAKKKKPFTMDSAWAWTGRMSSLSPSTLEDYQMQWGPRTHPRSRCDCDAN